MDKANVFISHITEESKLAAIFKTHIVVDFLGLVNVFVSSDTSSISAGANWLTSIDAALREACIELIICSKASIKRPWINFEAGAGWMRGIPIVPICHTGLRLRDLAMPLSVLQAIETNSIEGLGQIYSLIAKKLGVATPQVDFGIIATEIKVFEEKYGPKLAEATSAETSRDRAILDRIKDALRDDKFTWRKVDTLAYKGGVTKGELLDILRMDTDIVIGKGESGAQMAKLKIR